MRAHPALVLNADFQPLSYFRCRCCRGSAIKAVVEATHYVVEEYDGRPQPSTTMRCRQYWRYANTIRCLSTSRSLGSTCFCAPLSLPVLR